MFVNVNDRSLDVTASATPTAYALPTLEMPRVRIVNNAGGAIVIKLETSSTTTLTAPVIGTPYTGTKMADGTIEIFDLTIGVTHLSIYAASGVGTITIQPTYGE